MFKNRLIKLSSTENSGVVRFKEGEPVLCNVQFTPQIGKPIVAHAKSLTDFGDELNQAAFRLIETSYVVAVDGNVYTTETGSKYKLESIAESN